MAPRLPPIATASQSASVTCQHRGRQESRAATVLEEKRLPSAASPDETRQRRLDLLTKSASLPAIPTAAPSHAAVHEPFAGPSGARAERQRFLPVAAAFRQEHSSALRWPGEAEDSDNEEEELQDGSPAAERGNRLGGAEDAKPSDSRVRDDGRRCNERSHSTGGDSSGCEIPPDECDRAEEQLQLFNEANEEFLENHRRHKRWPNGRPQILQAGKRALRATRDRDSLADGTRLPLWCQASAVLAGGPADVAAREIRTLDVLNTLAKRHERARKLIKHFSETGEKTERMREAVADPSLRRILAGRADIDQFKQENIQRNRARVTNIQGVMHEISQSRHQVMRMQQLLRPKEDEERRSREATERQAKLEAARKAEEDAKHKFVEAEGSFFMEAYGKAWADEKTVTADKSVPFSPPSPSRSSAVPASKLSAGSPSHKKKLAAIGILAKEQGKPSFEKTRGIGKVALEKRLGPPTDQAPKKALRGDVG